MMGLLLDQPEFMEDVHVLLLFQLERYSLLFWSSCHITTILNKYRCKKYLEIDIFTWPFPDFTSLDVFLLVLFVVVFAFFFSTRAAVGFSSPLFSAIRFLDLCLSFH